MSARLVRSNLQAALEDVALWHERDITHSSVERVILPDSSIAVHYLIHLATNLVEAGMPRDEAYAAVQRAAADTWERGLHFRERMWQEIEDRAVVTKEYFWALFTLGPFVGHLGGVFERLEKIDVSPPASGEG